MMRCADGTFYTGVTTDVTRRAAEHNGEAGKAKGARYTASRRPVRVVYTEKAKDRSAAQSREAALRRLSREDKRRIMRLGE